MVVGGAIGVGGSYFLSRQQRGWETERSKLGRELEVIKQLDEALVETELRIAKKKVPDGEDHWEAAHKQWEEAWVRVSPLLANREVKDR